MNKYLQSKREMVESIIRDKVGTMKPKEIKRHIRCEFNSNYSLERYFYDNKLFLEVELIIKPEFAIIKINNYIDKP